jgi:hypothetical protein
MQPVRAKEMLMRRYAAFLLVLAFTAGFGLSALDVHAQSGHSAAPAGVQTTGGPDTYGYTYRDNVPTTGGCSYNFIDISSTGTAIGTGDDSVFSGIPIGFNFSYYGTAYTSVNVATNGYIAIGTTGSSFSNSCPMPVTLNDLQISPFWDDLYVFSPSTMVYQTTGSSPNRKFIVQWNNVGFCCTSPPSGPGLTFQVQMWEGTNIIAFMYSDIQQTAQTQGNSATIGIDGPGTTNYLQYMCNQTTSPGPLVNGRAVFFLPPGVSGCVAAATSTPIPPTATPAPVGGIDVGDQVAAGSPARSVPATGGDSAPAAGLAVALILAMVGLAFMGWRRR